MQQKIKGVVLHTLKYKDTSVIADIYTEQSSAAHQAS
ncbi:recombination protein O N-terminal domain-containing protein [Mediterranea massiliensis]|nr:recombination protein O N-terminal domain-containing protein [Mediterranea massiliensis]MDM8338292.1 recombination protein O N-terminal domain-containing protein [Mediterranea massiliensis]